MSPSYGGIYCHELPHINTDECAALELYTNGAKLLTITGPDGKLTPVLLDNRVRGRGNIHHARTAAVSIVQACETGVVYQVDQVADLAAMTRDCGLRVHMDDARVANALVTNGASPAEMKWKVGIDMLASFPSFRSVGLSKPIHVAFSYSEETGGYGMPALLKSMSALPFRPKIVIVGAPTKTQIITGHKRGFEMRREVTAHEVHSRDPRIGVSAISATMN